ncbi:hypothetical protein ACWG0P_14040 [Amedibacillus sp. YH-ame6]
MAEEVVNTEAEEVVVTQDAVDKADPSEETILKKLFDKKVSELNKKLKERMSEDEKRTLEMQEKEERLANIEKENKTLKMNNNLAKSGLSEKAIESIVAHAVDGNTEELALAISKAVMEATSGLSKQLDALKIEQTVRPDGNGSNSDVLPKTVNVKEMDITQLQKAIEENPEQAEEIKKQMLG